MFKSLAFLVLLVSSVSAQITAPARNYNVTSPVNNGPYVVDQILPCTYTLFSEVDSSSLHLQILLKPVSVAPVATGTGNAKAEPSAVAPAAPVASPTASGTANSSANSTQQVITIAEDADVSKTEASAKHAGNLTYYEHSINFKIPRTVLPGKYKVVFLDTSTNTETQIPIEIRSAAAATASTGTGGKTSDSSLNGSSNDSKSIFASNAIKPKSSSFLVSCLCVFIAAASIASVLT
ncbi:hypothetical protein BJV82DRAFT_542300 [Fennellomyces sp. T-0311]|nr:hypothetical protein BJV82DRAFT_542300 [Fennellomyces sp. T-0311]